MTKNPFSDVNVQEKLQDLLEQVKASPSIYDDGNVTENWFEEYLKTEFYDITRPDLFVKNLRRVLKLSKRTPMPLHVKFDKIQKNIISSRFMFQSTDIKDAIQEVAMIKELRLLAEKNKENFNITFYNLYFPYIGK